MENSNLKVFSDMPIPKAVAKSAIPAVLSMVVVLLYNIADTFFVGQTNDYLQVAAVSVTTPVFLIFMAVGTLFGVGGTSVISRAYGAGKYDYGKKVSSFCFYMAIVVGVVFIVIFQTQMDGILAMIGTSPDTIEHARSYLSIIAYSAPFVLVSTAFSNIIRAEGKPTQAMVGNIIGTVVNIVLDPIMILWMDMGVAGAALATVIGNMCSTAYYIIYFLRGKSMLSISIRNFSVKNKIASGVLAIGIPACLNSVLMSVSNIIMNNVLVDYGDIALSAMGVAMKVVLIVTIILIGFGQGIQPLLGYNYGARNWPRANGILKYSMVVSIVLGVGLTLLCWLGADGIIQAFLSDPAVHGYGVAFVKALLISGPALGIAFVFTNALQAMGAAVPSFLLSVCRQGLIFIPLLYILNHVFGLDGVVYAQPVVDYISIGLSAALYFWVIRRKIKETHPLEEPGLEPAHECE